MIRKHPCLIMQDNKSYAVPLIININRKDVIKIVCISER